MVRCGMQSDRPQWFSPLLRLLVSVLILKVTIGIVLSLGSYVPPQCESGFLDGRGAYFWDGYHLAFYTHIVNGPCSLLLGMVLLSERFRRRFPGWHRKLGRVQDRLDSRIGFDSLAVTQQSVGYP